MAKLSFHWLVNGFQMKLIQAQKMFVSLSQSFETLAKANSETFMVTTAAVALCAGIYAFFGYKMYRWSLACLGACVGGLLAFHMIEVLPIKADNYVYFQISVVVILGLIGGLIAPRLFHFFTFLLGGGALALALHPLVPIFPKPYGWLALVAGFASGGFMAFMLQRPTLIFATAIAGCYICGVALFTLAIYAEVLPRKFNFHLFEGFWAILAVAAIVAQFQQKTEKQAPKYQPAPA